MRTKAENRKQFGEIHNHLLELFKEIDRLRKLRISEYMQLGSNELKKSHELTDKLSAECSRMNAILMALNWSYGIPADFYNLTIPLPAVPAESVNLKDLPE